MALQMRARPVLPLILLVALVSVAQDANQQPLPTAPSAQKYPAPQPPAPQAQAPSPVQTPPLQTPPAQTPAPENAPPVASTPQATPPPNSTPQTPAQAAENNDQDDKLTTIVKQVDEVNVVFTVTDKRGKFINDLTKSDFQVVDDNKPAQQIRSFRAETNLPLRVGLLIDASNSIRDRFKFEQESAIEFLNQIIHQQDQAFVLGFDTTPEVTQNFTNNTEALAKGVRKLRPGGGTAMYDAIYSACRDEIMAKDKGNIETRRAI